MKSSLKTTDKAEAKRKLAAFISGLEKTDATGRKITMAGLVDRYLETLGTQAATTIA